MSVRFLRRTSAEAEPDAEARELRRARVEAARRSPLWSEVAEGALVERERFLVDADSDAFYVVHRGAVFVSGSSSVLADRARLSFYVTGDAYLVFLEEQAETWTEYLEKLARRRSRREAPRARPAWMDSAR